jgi:hypothetical protein
MNRFQRQLLKRGQNIRTNANGQADNTTLAELLARRWRETCSVNTGGFPTPLVATRAEDDITQELQHRGYTPATDPATADFTLDFSIGQYREGTLAIDVFDARTHRPVWHGWVKKELSSKDIEQPAEPISKAVSAVLAKFPPA